MRRRRTGKSRRALRARGPCNRKARSAVRPSDHGDCLPRYRRSLGFCGLVVRSLQNSGWRPRPSTCERRERQRGGTYGLERRMVKLGRPMREEGSAGQRGAKGHLRAQFVRSGENEFSGFVCDPLDPNRKFVVELWLRGLPVRLARADNYVASLASEQFGDGCYGFAFSLTAALRADSQIAEARLANSHEAVGDAVHLDGPLEETADSRGPGGVEWIGGLLFQGWIQCPPAESPLVRAVVDGETVAEARASGFPDIGGV